MNVRSASRQHFRPDRALHHLGTPLCSHAARSQSCSLHKLQPWRKASSVPVPPAHQKVQQVAASSAVALVDDADAPNRRADQYDDEIWGVALPALASMLLEPIIGVINTGMIGRLGTLQLGAVSMASIVVSFAGFLFSFLLFLTTPEIASAMVRNDRQEVSRISSKSLWVALGFSVFTTTMLLVFGDKIIAIMAPPEPMVAQYASEYVRIRAWGVLPVLVGFVATGTYRGFKDTRTPLYAAFGAAASSLVLTYLFLHVFGWGVKGGALAVVLSQSVSTSVLFGLLLSKGMLMWKDVIQPPPLRSVLPMLRKGLVLGLRNIISFGMVLYASTLCVRAGSSYQASFEVVRQVWMLTIQFFECLNVATQTLCAAYLGAGNRVAAMHILTRLLQLGMSVGAVVGVVVFAMQIPVVTFFSKDPIVISQVLLTLPLVCVMFPFDAAASIMDGSLLAARQTDYMSVVQIVGSGVQFFVLLYLSTNNLVTTLSIWSTLKVLTIFRMMGGFSRNWWSPSSGYRTHPPTPMTAPLLKPVPDTPPTIATPVAIPTVATASAAPVVAFTVRSSPASEDVTSSEPAQHKQHQPQPVLAVAASSSQWQPEVIQAREEPSVRNGYKNGPLLEEVVEVNQECLAVESLSATVIAMGAAHDSELVEKRLRCYKRHAEALLAQGQGLPLQGMMAGAQESCKLALQGEGVIAHGPFTGSVQGQGEEAMQGQGEGQASSFAHRTPHGHPASSDAPGLAVPHGPSLPAAQGHTLHVKGQSPAQGQGQEPVPVGSISDS